MPEPTAADCMEAILQIATREDLSDEERNEAMNAVAEAAGDPAKMQALLAPEQEEETPPETEADLSLIEGPEPRPPVEYDPPPAERSPHIRSVDYARSEAAIAYGKSLASAVDAAAAEADKNPSEAQKASGNYKKGHVTIQGLPVTIENARGSTRSGKNKDGKAWSVEMKHHYGYIKRTESERDGDHIDVFIGPYPESEIVFIVDQLTPGGRFDEHKCMLGFNSKEEAKQGYLDCYAPDWKGLGIVTPMTMNQFKDWIEKGETSGRAADGVPTLYAAQQPKETTTEIVVPDKEDEPEEEEEEEDDDEEDSLIEVPDVPQDTDHTCWPAACMSVGLYHGVGPKTLEEWVKALGTTEEYSTDFQKVADYFESLGCEVEENVGMDLEDLEEYWSKNWPVLLAVSEYGPAPPKAKFQYGHCLVYLGGPKYGYVFAQDPSESNINQGEDSNDAPGRVMIEEEDFLRQWWDRDRNGRRYSRFGIAVGPPKSGQSGGEDVSTSRKGGWKNNNNSQKSEEKPTSPDVLDRPEVREAAEALLRAAGASDAEIAPAIEEAKGILSGEEKPAENPMKKQLLALADRAEKEGDKASAKLYRTQAEEAK